MVKVDKIISFIIYILIYFLILNYDNVGMLSLCTPIVFSFLFYKFQDDELLYSYFVINILVLSFYETDFLKLGSLCYLAIGIYQIYMVRNNKSKINLFLGTLCIIFCYIIFFIVYFRYIFDIDLLAYTYEQYNNIIISTLEHSGFSANSSYANEFLSSIIIMNSIYAFIINYLTLFVLKFKYNNIKSYGSLRDIHFKNGAIISFIMYYLAIFIDKIFNNNMMSSQIIMFSKILFLLEFISILYILLNKRIKGKFSIVILIFLVMIVPNEFKYIIGSIATFDKLIDRNKL